MPTTISRKKRSTNNTADVKRWQGILDIKQDGDFFNATHDATVEWQRDHRLVDDGVVGPATWGAAGVQSNESISVSPKAKANDQQAYDIAKRAAPNMPEGERQYALAVARGEGRYGLGWATPSAATIAKAKTYGLTGLEGTGSNNWGAVQGKGNANPPSFMTVDYHADGTPYTYVYKRYVKPEDGFNDMARILLKPNVKEAIARKDLKGAVEAQKANRYFELDTEKYFGHVKNNYDALTQSIGWETLLIKHGLSLISIVLGVSSSLLIGLLAWGKMKGRL